MNDRFDAERADGFARIALANLAREYPYHAGHLQLAAGDHADPHVLHPAFCTSYDWHSCVHMHWLLARVAGRFPALPITAEIRHALARTLTQDKLRGEADYFERAGTQSFERTYGWAWLLALAAELARQPHAEAQQAVAALQPLTAVIVQRYRDYLPRARYPIRYGMHANSAFGLAFALDYARQMDDDRFVTLLTRTAHAWFGADRDLPVAFEPSGADFLSPALIEAELMRRVVAPAGYDAWLNVAMPRLGRDRELFVPVAVTDRRDPQIVHLDGLNLSRAWCLRGIASALPQDDTRRPILAHAADVHLAAGMQALADADYVGSHWLASFALLAATT